MNLDVILKTVSTLKTMADRLKPIEADAAKAIKLIEDQHSLIPGDAAHLQQEVEIGKALFLDVAGLWSFLSNQPKPDQTQTT